jgi:hypothetical protein
MVFNFDSTKKEGRIEKFQSYLFQSLSERTNKASSLNRYTNLVASKYDHFWLDLPRDSSESDLKHGLLNLIGGEWKPTSELNKIESIKTDFATFLTSKSIQFNENDSKIIEETFVRQSHGMKFIFGLYGAKT